MPTLRLAIDAKAAKTGAVVAEQSLKKVKGAAKLTRDELSRFQAKTNSVGKSLVALRSPLLSLFGAFSGILIVKQAIKTIAEFEETIVTLGQVVGATEAQLLSLEVTARRLGVTTRFSATEAAEGLLFLARAGFTTSQSIEALPATLNLAQAGMLGLGEAADLASNVLKQFELTTGDTSRIVDDFINVSNRANTNVRQLGEAMKFAGPIANLLGQTIETTAAQIGVLGDAGIQAGMAGTNLRGVMLALASPTTEAMKAFTSVGLSLRDMQTEGLSVTQILERLSRATNDAGVFADIFGRRNAAAASIIGKSAERVRELTQAQVENMGAAEAQAKAMDDTLNGALKGLRSAYDELTLAIGDTGTAGAFRSFVEGITDGIRHIVGLREGFKGTSERAATAAAAIKLVAGIFSTIIALKVASVVLGIAVAMTKLAFASTNAALATAPLVTIFAALGAAVLGVQIGKFLGREFKIAAEFSAAFATGFLEIVENIRFGWAAATMGMSRLWIDFTAGMQIGWTETQGALEKGILEIMGFFDDTLDVDLARSMVDESTTKKVQAALIKNINFHKKANEEIVEDARKSQAKIDAINLAGAQRFAEIEKDFGGRSRKGQSFASSLKADIDAAINSAQGLNSQFSLTSKVTLDVKTNVQDTNKLIKDMGGVVEKKVIPAYKKLTEGQKLLKSAVASVTSALTDGIFDAITGAKDLRSILRDTGKQISQQIAKQAIASAIGNLIGGFASAGAGAAGAAGGAGAGAGGAVVPSAKGNVFSMGSLIPMANGAIVNGPVTFPMSHGNTGLMGEAGPEAVLPLSRNKRGQLGVNISDGGQGKSVNVTQNFNITTPNPDSFRNSRTQIFSDASAGLKGAF